MPLGIADDFTQLALHVLAHVPRPAPGDLYDPRHVARAAALHAPLAHTRLRDDAALIAAMPGLDVLDLLPLLHRSLAAYAPTAARPLADLAPHEVADPAVLRALQETPSGELVHITLALLADEFSANYAAHIVPWCRHAIAAIVPRLTALAEHAPHHGFDTKLRQVLSCDANRLIRVITARALTNIVIERSPSQDLPVL